MQKQKLRVYKNALSMSSMGLNTTVFRDGSFFFGTQKINQESYSIKKSNTDT